MTALEDLRDVVHGFRRRPAQLLWAAGLLALAIGANGALFSVADALLLRPLPYAKPDRLVWIWSTRVDRAHAFFSLPDAIEYRSRATLLEDFVPFADWNATLLGSGDPERLLGVRATADAFTALGVRAQIGRALEPGDDDPGAGPVVVLSEALWRSRFGGDPQVVGAKLVLDGEPRTVVGVLPAGVRFPGIDAQVVAPLVPAVHPRQGDMGTNFLRAFARLRHGVSLRQARAELAAINEALAREHPVDNAKKTAPLVLPLQDELVSGYRAPVFALLGAVGVVLLIACFNLGNLLLARALSRRHELSLRAALGATPPQLARRAFLEVLLLAAAAAVPGVIAAAWGADLLLALAPSDLPLAQPPRLDGRVIGYVVVCALLSAAMAGLAPAALARRSSPAGALAAGLATTPAGHARLRGAAVVAQIALSLVLLGAAGLLARSFARVLAVDPGFSALDAAAVRLALPPSRHPTTAAIARSAAEVSSRVLEIPGTSAAGLVSVLPLSGILARTEFIVDGHAPPTAAETPAAQNRYASPGYFEAAGIPLLAGRPFAASDDERGLPVAIVDETFAARHLGGRGGLGAHLLIDDTGGGAPRRAEVVGIVGPVRHESLEQPAAPTIYTPVGQAPRVAVAFLAARLFLVVRGTASPDAVARAVQSVAPDVPVFERRTLGQRVAAAVAPRRFVLVVLMAFAASALSLAMLGVAALVSASVSERTRELGIRRALGARRPDLLMLLLGRSVRLWAAGTALGLAVALTLGRSFASLLYGVSATDPGAHIGTAALLLAASLLATAVPARRALRIDPATALRAP